MTNQQHHRSFLKWAGGKFKLLNLIAQHLPTSATRTVEPFAGSAVFSLNLGRGNAIINDLNADVINLYKHLVSDYETTLAELKILFVPSNNAKDAYLSLRTEFNTISSSPRKSALFVYLNKHGFNGLVRYNGSNKFNVPFGSYKSVSLPEDEIKHFAQTCKDFSFASDDYNTTLASLTAGDVAYLDPPYAASTVFATNFTSYTKTGFSVADQLNLVSHAIKAKEAGATTIISNHYTPDTAILYKDASTLETFEVSRSISASADKRIPVQECLAIYSP